MFDFFINFIEYATLHAINWHNSLHISDACRRSPYGSIGLKKIAHMALYQHYAKAGHKASVYHVSIYQGVVARKT